MVNVISVVVVVEIVESLDNDLIVVGIAVLRHAHKTVLLECKRTWRILHTLLCLLLYIITNN